MAWVVAAGAAVAQTPGLVVDAASGRVLFAERATDPWYPASITKLMTVYVALEQVQQGRIAMNSLLTMSETAASQPPSKLGLRPGQTMTLENAIKVIMVKSANDVAHMIGENLGGGTVEGFAEMMNAASQRLGMHESRWTNPSGLPDFRQQTSARDMALLARALVTRFPEHDGLFRIGAVKLGQTVMRNHNGLLGRYPGADGMKTGFICSGGFNVVATSTRNGRRLIAVVMGYPSSKERDLRTADLFDAGFSSAGWSAQTVDSLPPSASMTAPDMRPVICGPKRKQPREDDEQQLALRAAASGNAENPIASLFSGSALGLGPAGTAALGSRRDLGPRVAFEPIPVWLGASPGAVANEDGQLKGGRGRRVTRVAGQKDRAKPAGRTAPGPAAIAFTSSEPAPIAAGIGLAKPKAAGAAAKPKLGAITAKPTAKPEGLNPGANTAAAKARAKPKLKAAEAKADKPKTAVARSKPATRE
ncbi:D-alanyl-D-alanine carboxypeptidase family protein [Enterovirga sp.]|uniref:D-alanyl-D-alanine carboxypeptidase family protein n=1 Tax=Enterovirga sp. TaxID=2026350 RepID=UPI00261BC761|nr:D-alanyl-D-alanine carboxypeptidase family protein [Enterovirga sp.]